MNVCFEMRDPDTKKTEIVTYIPEMEKYENVEKT